MQCSLPLQTCIEQEKQDTSGALIVHEQQACTCLATVGLMLLKACKSKVRSALALSVWEKVLDSGESERMRWYVSLVRQARSPRVGGSIERLAGEDKGQLSVLTPFV